MNDHMPFPRGIWLVLPLAFNIILIGDVDPDPDLYVTGPHGSRWIIIWTDPDRIRNTVKNGLNLIHVNQTDHYSIFTIAYRPHRHGTGA